MSCTRKTSNDALSLSLSFGSNSGISGQSATGMLEFVAVNVQLPTGPIVKQFDFGQNPIAAGVGFTLTVPDVPQGTFLVQFLGVYKDPATALRTFTYGDTLATVAVGDAVANIAPASIGTSTQEGNFVGRYINSVAPEDGPTGMLTMQFSPPNNKPKMSLQQFPILNGWFSVMLLDGAPMDYVLPTGEIVFKQVQLSGATLLINGNSISNSSSLLQITRPAYYKLNNGSTDIKPQAQIFMGYMQSASLSVLGNKHICYPSSVNEAIPGAFQDAGFLTPLEVATSSGTSAQMRVVGGGTGFPANQIFTESATFCSSGLPQDNLFFYHTTLDDDSDRAGGISAPFMAVNPFSRYSKFLSTNLTAVAAVPTMNLKWRLLPALNALSGTAVFAKFNASGGGNNGGGGGPKTCDSVSKDYTPVGTVSGTTNTFSFTGLPGIPLTFSNAYNFSFLLCGYHQPAAGAQEFVGNYIQGSLNGDSGTHTGWANSTQTLSVNSTTGYGSLGDIQRVTAISSAGSPLFNSLTIAGSMPNTNVGDEVMIHIVGASGTSPCGTSNGSVITAGQYGFARVLDNSGGGSLKISKGNLTDQLASTNLNATATAGGTFCYAQVVKVLQYRNLTFGSIGSLAAGGSGFQYGPYVAAYLPVRVNGLLTLAGGTPFNTDNSGFAGGQSISRIGAGDLGPTNSSISTGTGGGSTTSNYGGGGAGVGNGATSTSSDPGGVGVSAFGQTLLWGGGGAGATGSAVGGSGGGIIFISARNTNVSGNNIITANGGAAASGTYYSGAGGGGSVQFITRTIAGPGNLTLQADGGAGNSSGAVGGGGYLQSLICDSSTYTGTLTAHANAGASGVLTNATNGYSSSLGSTDPNLGQSVCRYSQ